MPVVKSQIDIFFFDSDPHKCKKYRQIYNFLHSSLMKFFFAISNNVEIYQVVNNYKSMRRKKIY